MSTDRTWADSRGNWHARVMAWHEDAARKIARARIMDELDGRGYYDPDAIGVELVAVDADGWIYRECEPYTATLEVTNRARGFCRDWHSGQASMLYAIASTGALSRGTRRPDCTDTDPEWDLELLQCLEWELEGIADDVEGDDVEVHAGLLDAVGLAIREREYTVEVYTFTGYPDERPRW